MRKTIEKLHSTDLQLRRLSRVFSSIVKPSHKATQPPRRLTWSQTLMRTSISDRCHAARRVYTLRFPDEQSPVCSLSPRWDSDLSRLLSAFYLHSNGSYQTSLVHTYSLRNPTTTWNVKRQPMKGLYLTPQLGMEDTVSTSEAFVNNYNLHVKFIGTTTYASSISRKPRWLVLLPFTNIESATHPQEQQHMTNKGEATCAIWSWTVNLHSVDADTATLRRTFPDKNGIEICLVSSLFFQDGPFRQCYQSACALGSLGKLMNLIMKMDTLVKHALLDYNVVTNILVIFQG